MDGDILLDKAFSLTTLKNEFASILGVEKDIVVITPEEISNLENYESTVLMCVVSETKGDFHQLLEVFYKNGFNDDLRNIVAKICIDLSCNALVSDDDVNPFSFKKITCDGVELRVYLDPNALEDGSYIVKFEKSI